MQVYKLIFSTGLIVLSAVACNFDKDRHLEGQPAQKDRSAEQPVTRAADGKTAQQGWVQRENANVETNVAQHKVLELDAEIRALKSAIDKQGGTQSQCSEAFASLAPQLQKIEAKLNELKKSSSDSAVGVSGESARAEAQEEDEADMGDDQR